MDRNPQGEAERQTDSDTEEGGRSAVASLPSDEKVRDAALPPPPAPRSLQGCCLPAYAPAPH